MVRIMVPRRPGAGVRQRATHSSLDTLDTAHTLTHRHRLHASRDAPTCRVDEGRRTLRRI